MIRPAAPAAIRVVLIGNPHFVVGNAPEDRLGLRQPGWAG
jgi:hypothetical protein